MNIKLSCIFMYNQLYAFISILKVYFFQCVAHSFYL